MYHIRSTAVENNDPQSDGQIYIFFLIHMIKEIYNLFIYLIILVLKEEQSLYLFSMKFS